MPDRESEAVPAGRIAASEVYTWEPSDTTLATRWKVPVERIVRFDLNTSPVAPAFLAEALRGPFVPPLNEYPDSAYEELAAAAAAYVGAAAEEIIVGAGADEVLDIVAKACLPAGSAALVPTPTYGMYPVLSAQRDARVVRIPRLGPQAGWALDVERVVAALPAVRLVWLCAPNNPTGAPEAAEALEAILEASALVRPEPPVVLVDEAYHEFWPGTVAPLRTSHRNLVVVRTVSKAFALPGVRVGWAVAARPLIALLERVRPPGSIATISAALAVRALRQPEDARARVAALVAERDWLAARLAQVGWTPYPSVTNFLLVPFGDYAAAQAIARRLLRQGLVPRTFPADSAVGGHLRLTVRSRAENERLVAALGQLAT
ncbi:MAG: pyridoxal phosphate-dependent aminotransferase [Candidatus Limnocylindrales bacterium]